MGSQDGGPEGGASGAGSADAAKKDSLYENRPGSKKIIRVVTVMAYMVSVSFVAIILSGYYIFLWQPPNPRLLHRDHLRSDPHVEYLVDKPPTELSLDEATATRDIHEKINLFRQEILRNRGVNILTRPINTTTTNFNETFGNNSQISKKTSLNPIVRALINTRFVNSTIEERSHESTTGVYESINDDAVTKTSLENLTLFMRTTINSTPSSSSSSTTRTSSSFSITNKSQNKIYKTPVNDFTLRPAGNFNDTNIKRSNSSNESHASTWESLENSKGVDLNYTDEISKVRETTLSEETSPDMIQRDHPTTPQFVNERKPIIVQPHKLGSNVSREILPMMPLMTNDTRDLQKSGGNLSAQISTEFLQNSSTDDVESSVSPIIVEPEPFLSNQEHQGRTEERLTKDTSDFDFI